jgi:hypothetical protein
VPEDSLYQINTHLEEGARCVSKARFSKIVDACAGAVTELQEFHLEKLQVGKPSVPHIFCCTAYFLLHSVFLY